MITRERIASYVYHSWRTVRTFTTSVRFHPTVRLTEKTLRSGTKFISMSILPVWRIWSNTNTILPKSPDINEIRTQFMSKDNEIGKLIRYWGIWVFSLCNRYGDKFWRLYSVLSWNNENHELLLWKDWKGSKAKPTKASVQGCPLTPVCTAGSLQVFRCAQKQKDGLGREHLCGDITPCTEIS